MSRQQRTTGPCTTPWQSRFRQWLMRHAPAGQSTYPNEDTESCWEQQGCALSSLQSSSGPTNPPVDQVFHRRCRQGLQEACSQCHASPPWHCLQWSRELWPFTGH